MTTYLTPEVQAGLDEARRLARRKSSRLRVCAGGVFFPVLKTWENGFALDLSEAGHLRGRVDLYEGPNMVSQCLIVAAEGEGDVMRFEYKRMTEARGEQPVDFERAANAPVALIGQG